jgi:bacterioferritin-associated ferredoxin
MIQDKLGLGSVCGSCIPETQILLDQSRYAQLEIDESILLGI